MTETARRKVLAYCWRVVIISGIIQFFFNIAKYPSTFQGLCPSTSHYKTNNNQLRNHTVTTTKTTTTIPSIIISYEDDDENNDSFKNNHKKSSKQHKIPLSMKNGTLQFSMKTFGTTTTLSFNGTYTLSKLGTNETLKQEEIPSRAFPFRHSNTNHSELCFESEKKWRSRLVQKSPTKSGLFMIKPLKVGGSTAAGIHLRIARNIARRTSSLSTNICKIRFDHAYALELEYDDRIRSESFLWSIIREPTSRTISQFFHFEVSRRKVQPTDINFQNYIDTDPQVRNHYFRFLSTKDEWQLYRQYFNPKYSIREAMEDVLNQYDFIGVTERMEESIVALQLLLGLPMADVLYVNAKGSGGFDDGKAPGLGCVFIVPSFISPGMKEYFQTNEARQKKVFPDLYFYQAVNKSLDRTIDETIGRERFNQALLRFQKAQRFVQNHCLQRIKLPCTSGGEAINSTLCLWHDSGCGMACLDSICNRMELW